MIIFPRLNSPERVKTVLYDLDNIFILFLLFIYDFRVVLKSHLKWSKSSDVTVLHFSGAYWENVVSSLIVSYDGSRG